MKANLSATIQILEHFGVTSARTLHIENIVVDCNPKAKCRVEEPVQCVDWFSDVFVSVNKSLSLKTRP